MKTKNKNIAIFSLIILAVASIVFVACNDEQEEMLNKDIEYQFKEGTVEVPIFIIKNGKRKGNVFTGYCQGNRGICFLLFHKDYNPAVIGDVTTAKFMNDDIMQNLNFRIDYSRAPEYEKLGWIADIEAGEIEITEDIMLSDSLFLQTIHSRQSLLISAGRYNIDSYNLRLETFSINLPYSYFEGEDHL